MGREIFIPGMYVDEVQDGAERDVEMARAFNAMLKAIDETLTLAWVSPHVESGYEHKGRWHIVRVHPHHPELNTFWVIQTPEGEYCEPQEMHLQRLQAMDTYTGKRTYRDFERARGERKRKAAAKFEEKRREFRELALERVNHVLDARIAVPGKYKDQIQAGALEVPRSKDA